MTTHRLKTWPEYFEAVVAGTKTFEIRKNDRDFKVGDTLILCEWDIVSEVHTGRRVDVRVTYLTNFGQPLGQVVMAIERTGHVSES